MISENVSPLRLLEGSSVSANGLKLPGRRQNKTNSAKALSFKCNGRMRCMPPNFHIRRFFKGITIPSCRDQNAPSPSGCGRKINPLLFRDGHLGQSVEAFVFADFPDGMRLSR
jgi:hypothetical protein